MAFSGPGPGRPKGLQNKITIRQREIAARVMGDIGTPEFDAFITKQREELMRGSMHPTIQSLWMHYFMGKPTERIEVADTTNDLDTYSREELRTRAEAVAARVVESEPAPEVH